MLKFKCLLTSVLKNLLIHDRQILLDVKYLRRLFKKSPILGDRSERPPHLMVLCEASL